MSNSNAKSIPFNNNKTAVEGFVKKIQNPLLQRLFMLIKLPSAFFMGVKIQSVSNTAAIVSVPYGWRSQNPFKSTYFAAQAAAAEMSTGVLAMLALQGRGRISMLITNMQGNYSKKANKRAYFRCEDGLKVEKAVQKALETGEAVEAQLYTSGYILDENGQELEVSNFTFTWSFKVKK